MKNVSGYNRGDDNDTNSCNGGPSGTSFSCDNWGRSPGTELQTNVPPNSGDLKSTKFYHSKMYHDMEQTPIQPKGYDMMLMR
jgi:hypothetical protein